VQQSPIRDLQSYDPEELWNYELGIKADLMDRRLRISAAAFYMDWTDLQSSFQQSGVDDEGNLVLFGGVDNAEQAYSQGLEFSFTALPTQGLTINGAVGYLEAEFEEFTAYITGQNRNLDNETIPNSPEWTLSFDADYRFPLSDAIGGFVRVEWAYRDSIVSDTEQLIQNRETGQSYPFIVPSYDFWNVRAGIETDNYTITAYAENAFDDQYFTNAYRKAFMGGLHVEPSRQVFGIRGRYQF
jgi:iron complex outermembrane receptor protein